MKSDKGIPYSRIVLVAGLILFLLFVIIALFNISPDDKTAPNWIFFLLFGSQILFFGIVGSVIFPNTKTIKIIGNSIEVTTRTKNELIPINKIKRIKPSTSIINQSWNHIEFYKIELKQDSQFGREIYYKTNPHNNNNFTRSLKTLWVKENAH